MQQYRPRHSIKFPDFSFSNFDIFRRENDVTKLAPKFAFSITGYLMTVSERPCYKDLKTEKKMKYVYPFKRNNVLKFEFPAILLLRGITLGIGPIWGINRS